MTASGTATAKALVPLVDALIGQPLTGLDPAELRARVALVAPQVARLEGWLRAAAGQVDVIGGGQVPRQDGSMQSTAAWLAEVRRRTPSAAGAELRTSALLRRLPLVADAVLDGVLTAEQAAVLTRLVDEIDQDALLAWQPQLITVAADLDPSALGRWVQELIATHCEPALAADAARGRAKRYLQTSREPDGSLRGRFVLAAEDAETVLTALEPLARRAPRTPDGLVDDRSAGQCRADALVEVCEQVLRHGALPDHGGHRPQLSYVLPADWAAARHSEAACGHCGPRCPTHRPPGFANTVTAALPGHAGVPAAHACAVGAWTGPQTRPRIQALLCDARLSRVLLDTAGQVRSLQSLTDTVTPAQRSVLAARDLGCTARGCTRPPATCDAHHLIRRTDGGPTTPDNLVLLCRRHHVLWHLGKLHLHHLHVPWHPHSTTRSRPPDDPLEGFFTSRP